MTIKLATGLFFAAGCFAQNWEVGGGAGYSWYENRTINSPNGTVTASIHRGIAGTAVVCENLYEHLSGEIRYVFQKGDLILQNPGARVEARGQSHTVTYDVLIHMRRREGWVRPFLAVGGGAKHFTTSGTVPISQPFPLIARLTNNNQWTGVVDFGGGVKFRLSQHVLIRADFRDYITPFPNDIFTTVGSTRTRGVLHQLTPLLGVSATW